MSRKHFDDRFLIEVLLLKMFSEMDIGLLKKYCNNNCTEEELTSILEWFEGQGKTREGRALFYKIWEDMPDQKDDVEINYDDILAQLHHKVNISHSIKLREKAGTDLVKYRRREYLMRIFTRAAAILLFPVLGFGVYMSLKYQTARRGQMYVKHAYNEVFSSVDAITKVTLPDGSNVWLNHSSSLKYPALFDGNCRMVELEGEGYFEVVSNSTVPFIVNTSQIQIKALGTTFNVMAYPEEDKIETSLISGIVEIQRTDPRGNVITLMKMKPQDLSVFRKGSNRIDVRTISDDRYFAWIDGKLVFNAEPLDEVVRKLSRWFNVDIQIRDPELYDLTYTATFVNETLPQVLELMAMVSPVRYSISDRELIGQGNFTKRKVYLSYRK